MISTLPTTIIENYELLKNYSALIITLLLLILLIQKEVVSIGQKGHWRHLSRALNVLIVPLGLAFLAISLVELSKVFL